MKKTIFWLIIAIIIAIPTAANGAPLAAFQGGTNIDSTTSTDVGKVLMVSSTGSGPNFKWYLGTVSSGSVTPTFYAVTTAGNTTTNAIQFAGGTSTAAFTIQGLLTAPTGSFTYIDTTTTNATFATVGTLTASNATITNVSSTNMSVSSSLLVAGKAVCLVDGTNCLATSTPTLQQVATAGNTTSLALIFAGGTSTANFVVTGTFSAQTTTVTNFTASRTSTLATTTITNLSVSGASTLTGNTTVGGTLGVTGDTTLSGTLGVTGASTLATTTVTNFTASNTSTLATTTATTLSVSGITTLTGAATAGSTLAVTGAVTLSSTLGVSGASTLATTTVTNFTASNTSTLATTTITSLTLGAALGVTSGGLGLSAVAQGDLLYGSATNVITALAKNTTASRYLSNSGTNNNPAWAQIDLTNGITGQTPLANGGTNANLTASNGGIFYSTASAGAILAGTATANKVLMSGASGAPSWSVPTYPNASATAGKIIRSDGTNFLSSTSLWPDTTTANQILYSSAANTIAGITTANSGVLVTSAGGVPSIATDIPTAVTIGSAYIYRVGGTDVSVADGGTGASTLAAHGVVVGNGTSAVNVTGAGTANQVLTSNGASADPTFQALPGATFGSTLMASNFNLSASNGVYEDTGLSITLPSAGTYWVNADVCSYIQVSAGTDGYINTRLYNSTDAAYVASSTRLGAYHYRSTAVNGFKQVSTNLPITVNGSKTIKLYTAVYNGTTYSARLIESDAGAGAGCETTMSYHKISN